MHRKKTSKKQKPLSFDDMPIAKLKPGIKTYRWNLAEEMSDPELTAKALFQCLIDGDPEAFKEIFSAHIEAKNVTQLAKKSKISRRTLYHALSKDGNPSLSTIAKLMHEAFSKVS